MLLFAHQWLPFFAQPQLGGPKSFTTEWAVVVLLSAAALYAVGRSSRRV